MTSIDVDFDVFKALTLRRNSEDESYNDVLRQILGIGSKKSNGMSISATTEGAWLTKGVTFPNGTEFRATYKGQTYLARVQSGALVVNGKPFVSPSPAAGEITGNLVNGWTFWECRLPGKTSWQILKALRK